MNTENGAFLRHVVLGSWWVVLLRGLLVTALGLLLITRPASTIQVIAQFLGAFLVVDGVLVGVLAIRSRHQASGWRTVLVRGILALVVGILVLVLPNAFVTVAGYILIFLVAAALLTNGIMGIARAIRIRRIVTDEWSMIAGGVLQVVMAIIIALAPAFFGTVFLVFLGIVVAIGGVIMTTVAIRMKRLGSAGGPGTTIE
jgi:uncharacterized membrane protein HdeD (DUF308 family)